MTTPAAPDLLETLRAALAGRYDIERLLGAGGMGSVFLGRDVTLDRLVAIKVITPEFAAARTIRDRFIQEARTVAKLRHPNIVAVYTAGETDGLLYFVMEYVEGESLRDLLLREGRCDDARAVRVLRDMSDALAYAHAQGIVHRDVKPENVLLAGDTGRALLTDFGVARALADSDARITGTGFVLGSPRYMSPEQASGERELDGRSDVYSLGLVGYEMFAGEPAIDAVSAASILVKQLTERPAPITMRSDKVPPQVAEAIERALEKEPERRWTTAADMARAIAGLPAEDTAPLSSIKSSVTRSRIPSSVPPASRPDLVRSQPRVDASANGAASRGRKQSKMMSRWLAVAVLLALLGLGGWWAARRDAGVPSGVDPRKSYLIAPFEIQSSDPKLAWLREASVSMLALNLSQWSDLNVVDYERSLDLLRDAKLDGARTIGLKDARAIARKAGVWTIVMGQVQSTADSLLVTASLYDVASGRRVDQAVRSIPLAADPRSVYDAIARDLLDIAGAPALDFNLAKGTTSSVEAFRAYLVGLKELNSWHLAQADKSFAEAIHADTTFALAYYKRALARGWWTPNDTSAVALIQQAVDNSARLSTRERDIVTAYSDLVNALHLQLIDADPKVALDRYVSAQRRYLSIVQRDSLATEAWYGLGDAYYHAQPDQFGPLTAANHSLALRAFNRTLALDSTFHLAYSHKLAIYQSAAVDGSPWVLVNDTIYYVPAAQRAAFGLPRLAERKNAARALAISEARAWVESDPDAVQAHSALVSAYIAANRLDSAIITIENASKRRATRVPELLFTVPALRMRSDPIRALSDLRTALDEFPADSLAARGNPNRFFQVLNGANVAIQVGSLRDLDRVKQTAVRAQPMLAGNSTAPIADWYALTAQAAMGVPLTAAVRRSIGAGFEALEHLPAPYGALARSSSLSAPYVMALATRDSSYLVTLRKWAPEGAQFAELEALMALSHGDTAAAMRSVKLFPPDSLLKTADFSFGGMRALARAEVLTALGDTRRALTMYEALAPTRFVSASPVEPGWALYTRSFLARGRLYEELGEKAKAQQAYTRFIELWKDADPSLQSQSRAARDGLARLGDAPPTRPIGR